MNIEQIWTEYKSSLSAFIHSRIANSDDAEDILQEVLLKTYENLNSIKSENSLKSWLFQITQNTIIDFYRNRKPSSELDIETHYIEDNSDPDIQEELATCIKPLLSGLNQEDADILQAVDIEGLSQKDYAAQIGVSYSTLKSRVQKSRRHLRHLFENCCSFSFDQKGNLMDFSEKPDNCKKC